MNKNKFLLVLLVFVTVSVSYCNAQLLETKHIIGISGGYGTLSGNNESNMFFPSEVNQTGLNIDISYGHKMYSWLSGGAVLGYYQFSEPSSTAGFAQIASDGGNFISFGPQVNIHTPHKEAGLQNRMRIGFAIAPQMHFYSGERIVLVDNELVPLDESEIFEQNYSITESSSGFSMKISPELNVRISQRVGLKLSYHLQYFNVFTGYDNEGTLSKSFMGGLIITLGNYRHVFL